MTNSQNARPTMQDDTENDIARNGKSSRKQ